MTNHSRREDAVREEQSERECAKAWNVAAARCRKSAEGALAGGRVTVAVILRLMRIAFELGWQVARERSGR